MSIDAAREINVKCRAMFARLLDRSEYDLLLTMKSVSQIAEYLMKQTPYAYALRRIDTNDVHRGQLEQVFKKSLFYDYERLIKFTSGGNKAVIRAMFESYEIDDIKQVISSICSDNEHQLTSDDLQYSRTYGKARVESLLGADTMEALVGNLSGTRYHSVLLPFAVRDNPDFLKVDHALNLLDYNAKVNVINKSLGGAVRKTTLMTLGIRMDIENILFIYRMKKLYEYPAGELIHYLIPGGHALSRKTLFDLAGCERIGDVAGIIAGTKYAALFPAGGENEWEALHDEFFYGTHTRQMRSIGDSLAVALSYLFLKETDMKNIVMIIEGVRYTLPPDRIASYLIGYRTPPGSAGSAARMARSLRLTA